MKTAFATVFTMLAALPAAASAEPVGHITGLGGVFVTNKDPEA